MELPWPKKVASMSVADNTWFWVSKQSWQLASILFWEGANCLQIEQTLTLGFRDVFIRAGLRLGQRPKSPLIVPFRG